MRCTKGTTLNPGRSPEPHRLHPYTLTDLLPKAWQAYTLTGYTPTPLHPDRLQPDRSTP